MVPEVIVPDPPPPVVERQVPLTAKQPVVRLIPEVKVEVAVPVTARLVVVAFSAVKFWRVVEPERRRFESEVRPLTVRALPAPDWVMVTKVLAVEVALIASVRRNWLEERPSSRRDSKDAGTAPRILRGVISESHEAVSADPPIFTTR